MFCNTWLEDQKQKAQKQNGAGTLVRSKSKAAWGFLPCDLHTNKQSFSVQFTSDYTLLVRASKNNNQTTVTLFFCVREQWTLGAWPWQWNNTLYDNQEKTLCQTALKPTEWLLQLDPCFVGDKISWTWFTCANGQVGEYRASLNIFQTEIKSSMQMFG